MDLPILSYSDVLQYWTKNPHQFFLVLGVKDSGILIPNTNAVSAIIQRESFFYVGKPNKQGLYQQTKT